MKKPMVSFPRLPRVVFSVGVAILFGSLVVSAHAAPAYDWVTVGDPGNTADTTGYGAVNYDYKIGKYEVTIGQYTAFLNAVAKTDTYGLYNPRMAGNLGGGMNAVAGIAQTGVDGNYTYIATGPVGDALGQSTGERPIANVSWFNAARFANWITNGQPVGIQGAGTTETGAYTLNGRVSGFAPVKNSGATFYIPSENEWYKAAYYSPVLDSGSGGYWKFATQSDSKPGNFVGSDANQANWAGTLTTPPYDTRYSLTQSTSMSSNQNYLTDVGAFTASASYYGTFDQSGNLSEWNDYDGRTSSDRGVRGGSWNNNNEDGFGGEWYLSKFNYNYVFSTADVSDFRGFRLAAVAVPEPSTYAMALAGLACGGYSMFRRHKRA